MNLNNVYSAVIKSLKDNSITAVINEAINIERLKTMYFDYTGPREVEIRFIDPRKFSVAQRRFIFAMLEDIFSFTGQETEVLKEMFYLRFEALQGYKISLKNDSENTMDDATILANIILNFIFENNIPFAMGMIFCLLIRNIIFINVLLSVFAAFVEKLAQRLIIMIKR